MSDSTLWYARGNIARAVYKPVASVFSTVLLCVFVVLITWLLNWILVSKVWPEGATHLKEILQADFSSLRAMTFRQGHSGYMATRIADGPYNIAFEFTGIREMSERFAQRDALSIPD